MKLFHGIGRLALLFSGMTTTMVAAAPTSSNLTIVIHHLFGDKPLKLAAPALRTESGEQISITRLAYILSEPSLKPERDAVWLTNRNWFAFHDAGKGDGVSVLAGLPARNYEQLRFYIGPDSVTDHADPSVYPPRHALNPLVNGLHWGWAGGYVYLALEGMVGSGPSGQSGYSYHLAGTPNRMAIKVPIAADLSCDRTVELDFHVDRAFAGPSPLRIADINSTHSREGDEIATRMKSQIEQAFTVRAVHPTTSKPSALPAAAGATATLIGSPYRFTVAKGFPLPELPADFPLTNERVALGKKLFHDTRLSRNEKQSCASCHHVTFAFADNRAFSAGVDGKLADRNTMPLFNLAWKRQFFWDGRAASLRAQAMEPIQQPNEMHESLEHVVGKLTADRACAADFVTAFGPGAVTAEKIGVALESFVLTLTSFDSKFDRTTRGAATLSDQEKRGFQLFVTEYDPRRQQFGADCFHCHGGALFSDFAFHNNGLALTTNDHGRAQVTHEPADEGKFATPSLRNVALTAPYMHDGRFKTLEEVVDHYDHGVRNSATLDPNLAKHPAGRLNLSAADKAALVAFLKTLTDEQFVHPPADTATAAATMVSR